MLRRRNPQKKRGSLPVSLHVSGVQLRCFTIDRGGHRLDGISCTEPPRLLANLNGLSQCRRKVRTSAFKVAISSVSASASTLKIVISCIGLNTLQKSCTHRLAAKCSACVAMFCMITVWRFTSTLRSVSSSETSIVSET